MAFEELAHRLVNLRKKNHLSQQQVADIIGVKRSAYAYYETGKSKPKFPALLNLSKIYGISVDSLLIDESEDTLSSTMPKYKTQWNIDDAVCDLSEYEQYIVLKSRLMSIKDKQILAEFIENDLNKQ